MGLKLVILFDFIGLWFGWCDRCGVDWYLVCVVWWLVSGLVFLLFLLGWYGLWSV